MLTKSTAIKIHNCHFEIEKANELIKRLKDSINEDGELVLKDAWGENARGLQMGIPSSPSSHSLYNVPPLLALSVIDAHIKDQNRRLEELKAIALIELKD